MKGFNDFPLKNISAAWELIEGLFFMSTFIEYARILFPLQPSANKINK